MKTLVRILCAIAAALILLLSVGFVFIEGAILIRGDWLLHEVPLLAFLTYFSRTALSAIAAVLALRLLWRFRK